MRTRAICVIIAFLFATPVVHAQRYDLGQRLRMMERAYEGATPQNRAKAVEPLKRAVGYFFAGKSSEATAALDTARFRLLGVESPSDAFVWANSLVVRPSARLDTGDKALPFEISRYSSTKSWFPFQPTVRATIEPFQVDMGVFSGGKLKGELPIQLLRAGDYTIQFEIMDGPHSLAKYSTFISIVPDMRKLLAKVKASLAALPEQKSTAWLSLNSILSTLEALAEGRELETDYPAKRLFDDAEGLLRQLKGGEPYLKPERSGQFWLTTPGPSGGSPIRLFVPEGLKDGTTVPLVVAMHGAGGSENLFFDGYGDGAAVRACRERGWMMVATRAEGIFGNAPPVAHIVDELATIYPIDLRRVFVMGHSMGATHTMAAVQAAPGRFAAVAALGGGGAIRTPAAVKDLPVFVACGAEDFALAAAKSLARTLERSGAAVTYKELPDVEHLAIVQAAMKDVFAFFDRAKPAAEIKNPRPVPASGPAPKTPGR